DRRVDEERAGQSTQPAMQRAHGRFGKLALVTAGVDLPGIEASDARANHVGESVDTPARCMIRCDATEEIRLVACRRANRLRAVDQRLGELPGTPVVVAD